MTKYAVKLIGDEQVVEKTNQKLLKKEGGETPLKALELFIKEHFHEIRTAVIEGGKLVVDIADDFIETFRRQLTNLLRQNFYWDVGADYELA